MVRELPYIVSGMAQQRSHTHPHTHMHAHMYIHALTQVRKVIVKSFKPYVKKICLEENGHVVMMGVFDTVDDTVLVKKAILTVCVCVCNVCTYHCVLCVCVCTYHCVLCVCAGDGGVSGGYLFECFWSESHSLSSQSSQQTTLQLTVPGECSGTGGWQ